MYAAEFMCVGSLLYIYVYTYIIETHGDHNNYLELGQTEDFWQLYFGTATV